MFEKIKGMMVDSLRIPEEKITEDAVLKDLGINSIDFADLIFQLEEEFNIEIDDDAPRGIKTVGDLVAYLEAKINF